LNGIFFIPVASIMLAGFFIPKISAAGAKAALFVGLTFYIMSTFILKVDMHFIHIWGIEFVLNMAVMFGVSHLFPNDKDLHAGEIELLDLTHWKYAKHLSIVLCVVTILIYILLGI
ncbi:MAG: solute:sodium symporter family transporter, partial [Cyclobacteriaceae bacterium]|nr:solute:sodium symporter family transporter [Cyclobacteriaceae bacterium]